MSLRIMRFLHDEAIQKQRDRDSGLLHFTKKREVRNDEARAGFWNRIQIWVTNSKVCDNRIGRYFLSRVILE